MSRHYFDLGWPVRQCNSDDRRGIILEEKGLSSTAGQLVLEDVEKMPLHFVSYLQCNTPSGEIIFKLTHLIALARVSKEKRQSWLALIHYFLGTLLLASKVFIH